MTNLTRRQTRQWLQPIRKAFSEIKAGEVDTIRGYPVTRIDHADEYARTDWAINGFVALIERLLPSLPADPMRRVAKKLEAGTPLVQTEIDACLRLLNAAETALTRIPRATIRQAVLAEQMRQQLSAAIAACKLKDEELEAAHNGLRWWMDAFPLHVTEADNEEMLKLVKALTIQPDDDALKAWVSQRIASTFRKMK